MLDRTLPPPYQVIDKIDILQVQTHYLDNGLPLHVLNAGEQALLRIEMIFPAGNYYEIKHCTSYFTIKMLGEGTRQKSSKEINSFIDQFGAFIDFNHGVDRVSISLYTLSKHLESLLPVLIELISIPSFPDKELDNLKNITLQNLRVNQEKNNYIASSKFRELLFGIEHPYGRNLRKKDIEKLDRQDLIDFFQRCFLRQRFDLLLVGKVEDTVVKLVERYFSALKFDETAISKRPDQTHSPWHKTGLHEVQKEGSLQSSIRLGSALFTKAHPDYFKMMITNEIFGGFFGSRLMKNIREEKGYTYGIYSNIVVFNREGYWVVGTDVKKEFTQNTLEEIHKEAHRLREELVDLKELETVQNYILGSFAGSLSTPFDLADIFKSIYFNNLDYSFYDQYIKAVQSISPEEIRDTARKYLLTEEMLTVVVGG
ncbi:MAG: pitrilysin family protein [Microscillaceae bacterium]|nr:pitrilysin family protein [Microscillaceae bacterium]